MAYFVDTCVLLRIFRRKAPERLHIFRTFRHFQQAGIPIVVAMQNLAEFWNVSTRPKDKNGHGVSIEVVARRLGIIERFCVVVFESQLSHSYWKRLVTERRVAGVQVHDARLASVMLAMGLSQIITINVDDFERYREITALAPGDVKTSARKQAE